MKKNKTFSIFIILLIIIILEENSARAMLAGEMDDKLKAVISKNDLKRPAESSQQSKHTKGPLHKKSRTTELLGGEKEEQINEQDLREYTHSVHNQLSDNADEIKAVYVNLQAEISYKDTENGISWKRPIWNQENDDYYSQLVKIIYESYFSHSRPNQLLASFEIGYCEEIGQEVKWIQRPLCNEDGILENYCSNPPPKEDKLRTFTFFREEEKKETEIAIKSSKTLETKEKESNPSQKVTLCSDKNKANFPILEVLDCTWIEPTYFNFPHSEITLLNKLWSDDKLFSSLFSQIPSPNLIRGIIIKLYSHLDICDSCQESIRVLQFYLQEKISKILGLKIPVFFIGINNQCIFRNFYYVQNNKTRMPCNLRHEKNLTEKLSEGTNWAQVPISRYVTPDLYFFSVRSLFKAYSGKIKKFPGDKNPNIFLHIRVPNLKGMDSFLKKEFRI